VKLSIEKSVLGLLAAVLLSLPSAPAFAQQVKVGVVSYARLLEESPQAKSVSQALNAEFGPRLQQLQQQQASLKAREEKLTKDGATMTPEQRSRAEKELRDGVREFALKKQEADDDANERRKQEYDKLQRAIVEEVRTFAKAQNFDIVIAEGVIYATPAVDITGQVLASLQSKQGARPTAAPATAPKPPARP
jgi:outer membrane protein